MLPRLLQRIPKPQCLLQYLAYRQRSDGASLAAEPKENIQRKEEVKPQTFDVDSAIKEMEKAQAHTKTYTEFKEYSVDWSYVERLLPLETIPPMPINCGTLPSGWKPPLDPPPSLPYFIGRDRTHLPALYLERRRDQLNPNTMDYEYVELVSMREISGDIFACEKDLKQYLEAELGHPVATYVDEIKGLIKVKGAHRSMLEKFIFDKGF